MTEALSDRQLKVMAVAASEIAPGQYYDLSDLRRSCFRRFNMAAIDVNLAVRELKNPELLQITQVGTVSIRDKGWDWVSSNRDTLVKIVGGR